MCALGTTDDAVGAVDVGSDVVGMFVTWTVGCNDGVFELGAGVSVGATEELVASISVNSPNSKACIIIFCCQKKIKRWGVKGCHGCDSN